MQLNEKTYSEPSLTKKLFLILGVFMLIGQSQVTPAQEDNRSTEDLLRFLKNSIAAHAKSSGGFVEGKYRQVTQEKWTPISFNGCSIVWERRIQEDSEHKEYDSLTKKLTVRLVRIDLPYMNPSSISLVKATDSPGTYSISLRDWNEKRIRVNEAWQEINQKGWQEPTVKENQNQYVKDFEMISFGEENADNEKIARDVADALIALCRKCQGQRTLVDIPAMETPVNIPKQSIQSDELNLSLDQTYEYIKGRLSEYGLGEIKGDRIKYTLESYQGCTCKIIEEYKFIKKYTVPIDDLEYPTSFGFSGTTMQLRTRENKKSILEETVDATDDTFDEEKISVFSIRFSSKEMAGRVARAFAHAIRLCHKDSTDTDPFARRKNQ